MAGGQRSRMEAGSIGGSCADVLRWIHAGQLGDTKVAVCIPALVVLLSARETRKGIPLTEPEVLEVRDTAPAIAMSREDAAALSGTRGPDIDPENVWEEWKKARVAGVD
jgi:hypothetical protein